MAGFRTFATGEVLTAANVNNFLMGQSVMRFADATARTAALGTDVVEGMLTYNLATDQLEVFDGTNFVVAAPEPPAGIGSNVVSTTKTDVFSASVATATFTSDVTGLVATITPSSATSKVLVIANVYISASGPSSTVYRLSRNGSATVYVGNAAGSLLRATSGIHQTAAAALDVGWGSGFVFVDSPATTSATSYGIQLAQGSGSTRTVVLNRGTTDAVGRYASNITLIEVAA